MIEVLNRTHNIASVSQEAVPERLKGHMLIYYLPDWDAIVIAGWRENTFRIGELIADYLELTPLEHEEVLRLPTQLGTSDMIVKIHETLEALYQIRRKKERGVYMCSV